MENTKMSLFSNDEIIKIIEESESLKEVIKKIGYQHQNSYVLLKSELRKRNIKIPKYKSKSNGIYKKKKNEEVFIKNSTAARSTLKNRIIKENIIKYECLKCKNDGNWLNEKLSLQIEHINGINNDNRIENLCFLCPNCHSQTETFSGKKIKKINYCICGNLIAKKSKKCIRCNSNDKSKNQRIHQRPEYEILIEDIKKYGYRKTGKKYGVSDNAIRKWERIEKYFNP